jgi:hypothetical protein
MATGRPRDVELLVVEVSPHLRTVLDAHAAGERRRLLGRFLLYSTIVFSVPLWLAVRCARWAACS